MGIQKYEIVLQSLYEFYNWNSDKKALQSKVVNDDMKTE